VDKAGDILKNLSFFTASSDPHGAEYRGMFSSWEKIAGQKLSQYSRIVDIENQSLLIEVDHPAIIQLLQVKYREILARIRRNYPQLQISDLRMFVKNPEYVRKREEFKQESFPGDGVGPVEVKSENEVNFESIENDNFRVLLQDMKKRSQC